MLTRWCLSFKDSEMKDAFAHNNAKFFKRAVFMITVLLLIVSLAVEITSRVDDSPRLTSSLLISIVNWAAVVIFALLNIALRKVLWVQKLVCPLLSLFIFVHLIESHSYEEDLLDVNSVVIFVKVSIGQAALYYAMVMFNQAYLLNLVVFSPGIVLLLLQAGRSMSVEMDSHWLALIGVFQIFCYTSIAYRTEYLSKMSFIGRESNEKSFSRWLKIFDTFPEGMAIVRDDGSIMYSNHSLAKLLECETQPSATAGQYSQIGVKFDPSLQAKKMLENVKIKKYKLQSDLFDKPVQERSSHNTDDSVWDFIAKNDDGATYEVTQSPLTRLENVRPFGASPEQPRTQMEEEKLVLPISDAVENDNSGANLVVQDHNKTANATAGDIPAHQAPPAKPSRFLTLNQIKVSLAGPMEKIFIARDESYIVTLKELDLTRKHMIDFTQNMMCLVDDYASVTSQNLLNLIETASSQEQADILNDCLSEVKRARYSIRDFQYIYDVAQNNFLEPAFRCVEIRASLLQLQKVCQNDTQKLAIEIKSEVSKSVPRYIAVEENLFLQVMINLLRMAMDTIVNKGYITMSTFHQVKNNVPHVVIDFELSSCKLDDREKQMINRLSNEKDFKCILGAEVEPHFKIAKILCNQLGWRIEFDANRDLRYMLVLPLLSEPSMEDELGLGAEDVEEMKEEEPRRPTIGIQPERIIASQQSQRNKNKKYLESEANRQNRPFTVDENQVRRNAYFAPVQEAPEGMEDLEDNMN